MDKPTDAEWTEMINREEANIRELLASPLGADFIRNLKAIQSLTKMFDKDPYIMAYRCAIHDVIGRILDLAEPKSYG